MLLAVVLGATALLLTHDEARAAAFTVDSLLDVADKNPGDGLCDAFHPITEASICTLRAAVQEANALPGADTIQLPMGVMALTLAGASEDAAATGDLDVVSGSALTITGMGVGVSVVDGAGLDRVFQVFSGGSLSLSGLTVQNGATSGAGDNANGGNIWNGGILTLTTVRVAMGTASQSGGGVYGAPGGGATINGSTIEMNNAVAGRGGGLYNGATMTVVGGVVTGNIAFGAGGGIVHDSFGAMTVTGATISDNTATSGGGVSVQRGTFTLVDSVVSGNVAEDFGGGVSLLGTDVSASITRSTVSANAAASYGGGIDLTGMGDEPSISLTIDESTISENAAADAGGGLAARDAVAEITNSTVSGNVSEHNGGGLATRDHESELTLVHVTLTNNTAEGLPGGGLGIGAGTVTTRSSILAGNTPADCSTSSLPGVISQGQNLSSDGTCGFSMPADLPGVDPLLGPLQDNGGPTETHDLLPGSPAINGAPEPGAPPTDQRGDLRFEPADIGAVETPTAFIPDLGEGVEEEGFEGFDIVFRFPELLLFGQRTAIVVEVISTRLTGETPLRGLTIMNALPLGFTFVRAEGEGWACSEMGGVVTCDYEGTPVEAGESAMVTLVVDVAEAEAFPEGGMVEHCATGMAMPAEATTLGLQTSSDILPNDVCQPLRIEPKGLTVEAPFLIGQFETLEFMEGGQFYLWSHGPHSASIFAGAKIVWCFCGPPLEDSMGNVVLDSMGNVASPITWISYVHALGVENFPLEDGLVLWVVAPEGGLTIFLILA